MNTSFFKKIIIFFWGLWWLIAFWTDLVGWLAHMGWLNASWAPDMNYPFLKKSLEMYSLHDLIPPFLFFGITLGSLISASLFFWTGFAFKQEKSIWMKRADKAFIFSLIFWFVFFLADQCIMKFDLEANHMIQGGFQLLTYFAMYLLP